MEQTKLEILFSQDVRFFEKWTNHQNNAIEPLPTNDEAVIKFIAECYTWNSKSTWTDDDALINSSVYLDLYQPSMDNTFSSIHNKIDKACLFTTSELRDLFQTIRKIPRSIPRGSNALMNAHKHIQQLIAMDAYMRTVSHLA
jgi:hypothetical protein